jgi:hypothetical protein
MNYVIHIALWGLMYAAFAEGYQGAVNLSMFYAWACALLLPFGLSQRSIAMYAKQPNLRLPPFLVRLQALAFLACFVWHGYVLTALAFGFAIGVTAVISDLVKKERARESQVH